MEMEWNVDETVHREGWKPINAITGEVSALAKGVATILDLGGGSGWFGLHLAKHHPEAAVISLDLVPKPGNTRVRHILGSALNIPLEDGSVDLLGANAILHHVPDDLDRCAAEMARVLKPGGRLLAQEPLADNPAARLIRGFVRTNIHEEGERPLPYRKMEEALLKSGLEVESRRFFFLTSYLVPHIIPLAPKALRRYLRRKGVFMVRLDRKLLEKLPGLTRWAAYVSIVARKKGI